MFKLRNDVAALIVAVTKLGAGAAPSAQGAIGAYEGFTGTFHSWGTFAPHKGQAILRYEGQICRPAAS